MSTRENGKDVRIPVEKPDSDFIKKREANARQTQEIVSQIQISTPIDVFPKIIVPMPVIKKEGLQFVQKQSIREAVFSQIVRRFASCAKSVAPTGYPPIKLNKKMRTAGFGIRNNPAKKENGRAIANENDVSSNSCERIKNKNVLGMTRSMHSATPFRMPSDNSAEKNNAKKQLKYPIPARIKNRIVRFIISSAFFLLDVYA